MTESRSASKNRNVVAEVMAYADQFAEFADQVRGMYLEDEDVLTIAMTSDGTLIGMSAMTDVAPVIVAKEPGA